MIAIFYLALQILKLYSYVVIANVVISWLVAFNVLNTSNRFVYLILDFTYKMTEPILMRIRRFSSFVDMVYRNVYEALRCTTYILINDFN